MSQELFLERVHCCDMVEEALNRLMRQVMEALNRLMRQVMEELAKGPQTPQTLARALGHPHPETICFILALLEQRGLAGRKWLLMPAGEEVLKGMREDDEEEAEAQDEPDQA